MSIPRSFISADLSSSIFSASTTISVMYSISLSLGRSKVSARFLPTN